MSRAFSVIAHNPNSFDQLRSALDAGASGLEPDVCFHDADQQFHVHEVLPLGAFATFGINTTLLLSEYLQELCRLIDVGRAETLETLIFDLKNPTEQSVNGLRQMVESNFGVLAQRLRIIYSCGRFSDFPSLLAQREARAYERIALDDGTDPILVRDQLANSSYQTLPCAYASGNSLFSSTGDDILSIIGRVAFPSFFPKSLENIKIAVGLRDAEQVFSMVYAWTVNTEDEMRAFLDADVDGLICDTTSIPLLKSLLSEPQYKDQYCILTPG